MSRLTGYPLRRPSDEDRAHYPRYVATLYTVGKDVLTGEPGQTPDEVVMAHYGERFGLLHWNADGYQYLVVEPAITSVERTLTTNTPTELRTSQRVVDYVVRVEQRQVSR